jgi:hypothetical protein
MVLVRHADEGDEPIGVIILRTRDGRDSAE